MKATNPGHAFGVVLVDELIRSGVRHVCISPGSRSTPLALAFTERDEVEVTVAHDERSGAFVALGIARATGAPVPVLCTSGTAAANFHPAVVEAGLSGVPLVVLTADRPPELRDTGANQAIDQIKLYGDSVVWFSEVGVPEALPGANAYWRSLACRAVREARRGGPVHLNCALREPLVPDGETFPFDLSGRPGGAPWAASSEPVPDRIPDAVLEAITSARRGLLVAGAGSDDPSMGDLAERLGWPLLADPLSNARRGPNAIETYDASLRVESFAEHHRPDVVVRFGRLGISKVLMSHLGDARHHVLLERGGRPLDPCRNVSAVVRADADALLSALPEGTRGDEGWLDSWLEADRSARRAIDAYLDSLEEPSEPRVARDLVASIPDGSSLFVGASMPLRDVEWFSGARDGVRFFGNRGANGIDGSLSTPVGIAIATGAPTFALVGDVSLLHDQNGLLLGSSPSLDLTIVCVNNDGGGIFSFLPQAKDPSHFEELFGTPHGRDLSLVARLHGAQHTTIGSPDELQEALRRGGGLRLIEVRTDRADNVRIHREVQAAVAEALG